MVETPMAHGSPRIGICFRHSHHITYEAAFDHSDAGVGLCLQLHKAFVLQKFVDMSLDKNISVHFVFTCPSDTSEFEASAWLYNLLHDKVRHIGFMQNLDITFGSNSSQEKYLCMSS